MGNETYDCECIDCGYKETSEKHCDSYKCPECGGTMRRTDRPGPGKHNKVVVVDQDSQKKLGRNMALYQRVCNAYKCEDIEIEGSEAYGISTNRLVITGLAVTHRPRDPIYIPRETFEKYGKNLIGKPLADGHGSFPWAAITVDEMLGVVVDAWYSEEREALMFKAEVWDEKAVEAMKRGIYVNFSVAYWYDSEMDKIENEYEEEMDVVKVTEMEFNHIAYLPNPQVPESEIKTIQELQKHSAYACYSSDYTDDSDMLAKTYRHNSTIKEIEPDWGDVDKTRLPWNAFSNWNVLDKDKKSTWKYPHHWINLGKMYLHKGGLVYALAAAKGARSGKRASAEVFKHLRKHIKAINLSYEDFCDEIHDMWDVVSDTLGFNDIDEVVKDDDIVQIFGGDAMKNTEEDAPKKEDEEELEEENQEEETQEEETEEETPEETSDDVEDSGSDSENDSEDSDEEPDDQEDTEEEDKEEKSEEDGSEEETPPESNSEEPSETPDAFAEKLASLMNELRKKDEKIDEYKAKLEAFESEKREGEILSKVDSYINDKKILPKNKDEIFNLLKTMTDEQIDQFFKVMEKNSAYPSGEKGKVPTPDAHSDEQNEEEEEKPFFT